MAKILTVKAVENARPRPSRAEIPDGDVPGFYLVIQPSGAKSWAYRYRCGGKTKKMTIGGYPQVRLADARDLARAAARSVAEGNDPSEKRKAAKEAHADTFEDVARQFIRRHSQEKNCDRHWKETARILGLKPDRNDPKVLVRTEFTESVIAKWGKKPISSITERNIIDLIDAVVDRGSPISANRTLAALRKLFKWARQRKIIERNPRLEMEPPGKERKGKRTLNDSEIRALWRVSLKLGYPKGTAYQLLLLSGQRLSLVARCRTEQLDRRAELWSMTAEQEGSKGADHVIPIIAALGEVFDECPHDGPFILSSTNGKKALTMGSKLKREIDALMVEELRREAIERGEDAAAVKLEPWDNHDIRRTVRTRLSALPVPEGDLTRELVIGHRKSGLHQVYDKHAYLAEKGTALELWEMKLRTIVSEPPSNIMQFPVKTKSSKIVLM